MQTAWLANLEIQHYPVKKQQHLLTSKLDLKTHAILIDWLVIQPSLWTHFTRIIWFSIGVSYNIGLKATVCAKNTNICLGQFCENLTFFPYKRHLSWYIHYVITYNECHAHFKIPYLENGSSYRAHQFCSNAQKSQRIFQENVVSPDWPVIRTSAWAHFTRIIWFSIFLVLNFF